MMTKKLPIYGVTFSAIFTLSSQAALTWQGTNNTFFQESNWQLDGGGSPAAGTVDPNTDITASTVPDGLILFDNSLGGTNAGAVGGNIDLNGNSLQIGGGLLLRTTSTAGLRRSTAIAGSTTTVSILGGSSADFQFGREIEFSLDEASTLALRGGNDPLPNGSTVDLLDFDSEVFFIDEDLAAFTTEHLSKFSVNGTPAVIGTNLSVVSDGGTGVIVSATAVPEPSSAALFGLGGLALLFRRRK
ncbi:PEP-CTERM sorting domain-containing protein [Akkermansiaceae bacterium]|nr:PEP-CTERM sorting domain-containing protein [Akkermansiaceae bacterium]MDA7888609.1 PEP-CTERM sorting domain-containing protein [Akkermansiaceae bacterium]MDB4537868.1 PEP-CTERM sorting domain-containing protein [Akkermansiaceae bacterium]